MQRYYKLGVHCSSLELEEKPPLDGVHHKTRSFYQTIIHNPFVVDFPSNCIYQWKMDFFFLVLENRFSFNIKLSNSTFIFTHQVKPIIEKVNFDDETLVATEDLAIEVYDGPSPYRVYVHLLEEALL